MIASVTQPILGIDFITQNNAIIDACSSSLIVNSDGRKCEIRCLAEGQSITTSTVKANWFDLNGISMVTAEDLFKMKTESFSNSHANDELMNLLSKWEKLFSGLGRTNVVCHSIITGDARPINIPPRRMPYTYLPAARENIQEMLNDEVIEHSSSEWSFPIVPVPKKDGSLRLAIDYRELNKISKKDAYPMPRIDEILARLRDAKIFSKLDLRQGYYQISIRSEDREKTAFRFEDQLFNFKRMSFGLSSAPQTSVRMMNRLFACEKNIQCYLDDCIVFSENIQNHLIHLERVFQIFKNAGLKLNRDKCEFLKDSVDFLGFQVGNSEIRPLSSKIEAIIKYPRPTTTKEISRWLGMVGYYRNLIQDFSKIVAPIQRLLQKGNKFIWSTACDESFIRINQCMIDDPVVRMPNLDLPFIVKTDACGQGIGALLLQEDVKGRYVVEFASKAFTDTQKRYPVIEQEATAIMFALERWTHYLLGSKFTLETDHRPLQWLKSKKNSMGKLGRMAARLAEFSGLEIKYIPDSQNEDVDALSRIADQISAISKEDLRMRQNSDEKLKDAIEKNWSKFFKKDNLWYFKENGGEERLCLAKQDINDVIKMLHDQNGHLGQQRTIELARERFYWPSLRQDIKKWVNNCFECATKKDFLPTSAPAPMLSVEIDKLQPFEKIGLDILGPLPETGSGNKYIVVLQDYMTKWVEATAMPACDAKDISSWLSDEIFSRFGIPASIVSDHGSQFDSKVYKDFCDRLGIIQNFATPYHHQSNGLVERMNRSLENMLRMYVDKDQTDWDLYLSPCLFAYRTSIHSVTKKSPFEAMFIRTARMPVDSLYPTSHASGGDLVNKMKIIRGLVRENLSKATVRRKTDYDMDHKVKETNLQVGDHVLWRKPIQKKGLNPKLSARWIGPYLIRTRLNDVNFEIEGSDGNTTYVHVNLLKKCPDGSQPLNIIRKRGRPPKKRNREQI